MYSYITISNESTCPAISVLVNDVLFFKDIIHQSARKLCPVGSVQITILDNREKVMHDLYVSVIPHTYYTLKVHTGDCILIQSGFS